ncbi:MucR family transcriptional regulator [Nitrospirillum sp. BR 11164]|uniref:MucR family transcriptional regulator n=1 Tax=Nitrospirillum sp. BR 11164 TaxID=3104324 RepID=UPI002AFE6983|nr:MucR family transcriptional regulator [Nitrospirillum sp. BR 11164]MEA1647839.1 MucR family transcriptional regulator [Nitrospirillum sp. BR 11164]
MNDFLKLSSDIVAAYVAKNHISPGELPGLIHSVYGSLVRIDSPAPEPVPEAKLVPAVPVRKSVTPDYIVCLEDGKKLKMLKRHLRTAYGLSPEEYREKWGLPVDYPMVAPNYAEQRSGLAKAIGLGTRGRGEAEEVKPAKKRGRSAA